MAVPSLMQSYGLGTEDCPFDADCRSGEWSYVDAEMSLPKVSLGKSRLTVTATAICYGVQVVPQTIKAPLFISCEAIGLIAEVGAAGTLVSGGFSNACSRQDLYGHYSGGNVSARFASAAMLWKKDGEQTMDLGVPFSIGGIGIHVSYIKCTVSSTSSAGGD